MNSTDLARSTGADESAWQPVSLEDTFARYQPELLGTLYYLLGNTEDARDAFQEAFVKCWRHRQKVTTISNLKAWVFCIALNTARDLRQTAWRRRRQPLEEAAMIESSIGPAAEVEQQEQWDRVRAALHQLRAEEKEVFLLRENGNMTYEQISEAIGVPAGTVKTRMRLAIRRLREALAEGHQR